MTQDEIRAWALEHGFSEDESGNLSQPYGRGSVGIGFGLRDVRTFLRVGEQEQTLVKGHPKRAFVNEYGVVEGIGLSASFLAGFDRGPGSPPPPWMPQDYLDAVGWRGEPAATDGAPKGP